MVKEGNKVNRGRRRFLKTAVISGLLLPIAGTIINSSPLKLNEILEILQPVEQSEIEKLRRLEGEYEKEYGRKVFLKNTPPRRITKYAMALDLNKCIGCRRCAYACVLENNIGRNLGIQWIKIAELPEGSFELSEANYDYEIAPKEGMYYMPIACMHCENPPCVHVCPVGATWKEPDGIVVIDYDKCIGCRYCMAACPYFARRFNWAKPEIPPDQLNPNMHYLGNRPRPAGVVEKCTWCIQRVRDGGVPACVEACPVGARHFGNLLDPDSSINYILNNYQVFKLKGELGTEPKFFYFFGPGRSKPRGVRK